MENCTIRRWDGEILNIINTPEEDGLHNDGKFKNDKDIAAFIDEDIEVAILCAVSKNNDNEYFLNIHPRSPHAALTLEGEVRLSRQQTEIYLPIIKYFLQHGFRDLDNNEDAHLNSEKERWRVADEILAKFHIDSERKR